MIDLLKNEQKTKNIIEDWRKSQVMKDDVKWFVARLHTYEIGLTIDGIWIDSVTKKKVSNNYMKCLLRGDYIASGRKLRGKALDKILNIFIDDLLRFGRDIFSQENYREMADEIEYEDKFL